MAQLLDDLPHESEDDYIFNEYNIDDTLDPLSRLLRHYQCDFSLQRLVLVRELADTARYAGFESSATNITPLLPSITGDSEPAVRQAFVQQLFPLATFFVQEGGESGYELLLSTLLPNGFELLVDKNVEVCGCAMKAIQDMATLVRPEHVQVHLLSVVITLAHDERAEDYRVAAAQLFNSLAPKFGPECCSSVVIQEVELLSSDSSFSVRKTVGGNLGTLCRVITNPVAQGAVVALYTTLCEDDIWGIRQACAESIEEVALGVPPDVRCERLLPAFRRLLEDSSRWVRNRAYESLGRLIHALPRAAIDSKLLRLYTDMAFQSDNGEGELTVHCAFSFPAIVEAVGPERWPELRDAYVTMLKDVQWKVRKSLAYSLHEVAAMVGTDIAEESLVSAFELLLRDLDDIKLGVVLSADKFLAVLEPATRERLVPLLCHVPLESENWRLRNEVARGIGAVAVLLPATSPAFSPVIALVQRLLDDSVMEVRASTYRPAALILAHLAAEGREDTGAYLQTIQELAERPSFQGRQMYAYLCRECVRVGANDLVRRSLLPALQKLCADRVDNVRLVLEGVVRDTFLTDPAWADDATLKKMAADLAAERVKDEERIAAAAREELASAMHTLNLSNTDGAPAASADADEI